MPVGAGQDWPGIGRGLAGDWPGIGRGMLLSEPRAFLGIHFEYREDPGDNVAMRRHVFM